MKILIVCSYNRERISPFISEQVDALNRLGLKTDYFLIKGTGAFGYLKSLPKLKKKVKEYQPDIIHAHYGLSGLLAVLQRAVPVVTTFHGSDVNNKRLRLLSRIASRLSAANIFVSSKMMELMPAPYSYLIPCGIDLGFFKLINKDEARIELDLQLDKKYILFSSSFDNTVKNYRLAKEACNLADKMLEKKINLIELKGYKRDEVNMLLNAVDCALLTSFNEGSPQFIKEAMACNCPIVSTNVGDVSNVIGDTKGCYITSFESEDVTQNIKKALEFRQKTKGRERIIELGFDSETIAKKISDIYFKALNK